MLQHAVLYALRFSERGKNHGVRMRDDPEMMAAAAVKHLAQSGYRIFKGPPLGAHSAPSFRHTEAPAPGGGTEGTLGSELRE
ncbi:hypothetical protein [Roseomonas sp. WA12]